MTQSQLCPVTSLKMAPSVTKLSEEDPTLMNLHSSSHANEKDKTAKLNCESREQDDLNFDEAWIASNLCCDDSGFVLLPMQSL